MLNISTVYRRNLVIGLFSIAAEFSKKAYFVYRIFLPAEFSIFKIYEGNNLDHYPSVSWEPILCSPIIFRYDANWQQQDVVYTI